MNYSDFKNGLENGKVFPIYLFEGDDAFFRERALVLLKNKYLNEPQLNLAVFEGDKLSVSDVLSSLNAYPFMSEKRITVVREYYPKASDLKAFKDYFEKPVEQSILIFVNEKTSETLKKAEGVTKVDCNHSDASTIARYVKAKSARAGVEIDLQTAKTLAEYCRCDMTRIEGESEKLICYALDKKKIELSDVEMLTVKDVEFKVFKMTEYVAKGNFDLALTVIYDMLGKGETMQRIMVSVYNYFRKLLHIAISDKTNSELAKLLGSSEDSVRITREQAKAFKKKSLKNAVDVLADTDYLIKSGKVDAEDKIWRDIFTIMTA